jgi:hypothetical protein
MFKDYNKGLYKSLFGDTRYHDYGYGFARGFEETTPNLKLNMILATSVTSALVGLVLGGPLVALLAGLITAVAVYFLYTDVLALTAGSVAKDLKETAEQDSPIMTRCVSAIIPSFLASDLGYDAGKEAGEEASEDLDPFLLNFA